MGLKTLHTDVRLFTLKTIALVLTAFLVASVFLLTADSVAMAGAAGAGAIVSMLRLESLDSISSVLVTNYSIKKISVILLRYLVSVALFFVLLLYVWRRHASFFIPTLLGTAVAPTAVFLFALFKGLLSLFTLSRK